ncbi:S9 family peptidase [Massilia sp. YIM B02763]|uniref:S9 family peptidase n=1 Tax=Massilia sp. YIM B02763 TaxID=3050130 RepID=UPI0025B6AF5E|nr:S9 family peptidase [Massilia sp. YIM B02763]MDN4052293.1 S9 family peptidase [Massilia sp. YIM B02763]
MTKKHTKTVAQAATLLALLAAAGLASADPSGMRSYRALALDGAGERIAAIESVDGEAKAGPRVVVRERAGGRIATTYQSDCQGCRLDAPAWSPDGKALAVVGSDPKAGTATVYLLKDGRMSALASVKGVASTVRWSPDGRQLAFLATVGARKLTGAVEAGARQVGEIGLAQEEDEQRIAVIPAAGGEVRLVSPADTFVYEYDWTPDGRGFVVTSAKGNGDNNWWVATLGHVDAASGKLRVLAAPKMQMNMPHVSPDGRTVAFIGGLMSDFGSVGGDVYTVSIDGGQPVDVTPNYKGTFNGIAWRGKELLASVLAGSDAGVATIDPAARSARILWKGPVTASAGRDGRFAFSADGKIAASVHEDYEHAPRIVAGRLPDLAPVTRDNEGFTAQVSARSVGWTNDGYDVQGWLIGPTKIESGKKYPMIVQVHGGPAAAVTPRYVAAGDSGNPLARDLVKAGYFVFMPNPRGSYGQGSAFGSANRRDFGGGDWRDILAGVDAAIKQAPIDGERLGLMGHSYGGFMTMWGVTHSQRFKAAVAGAGIANWISYYGQNGIDQWMVPFFGATMYDDPAVYRAASPIESIKAAKTPTLIYVGERDVECPPAQSFEFWHGLKAMGTPTALVVYEDEGHALRKPEHQKDLRARELAWFAKYLR